MSLPVWRELKLIIHCYPWLRAESEWAFPFEGNWNSCPPIQTIRIFSTVWMSLPVWRELNTVMVLLSALAMTGRLNEPSRLKGMETTTIFNNFTQQKFIRVWMSLPVWREWKLQLQVYFNFVSRGLNEPSRLKGIETYMAGYIVVYNILCLNEPSRLKGIETSRCRRWGSAVGFS